MFFVVLCLSPLISPPIALLMGLIIAQFIGHPYLNLNHKATHILLQVSVVGLGFGMNVNNALKAGKEGFILTIVSIIGTILIGIFLGKTLKIEEKISFLIATGTAICGGSAIAAISPIIKANEKQISVALGTVFVLNSVALVLFPFIGHYLNLSETQFGLWCAIAIHDTSSVVGAAGKYGTHALEVATTVKLARALWIIPLALITSVIFKKQSAASAFPWFILFFILASLINTTFPLPALFAENILIISKTGFSLTLFFIGLGISPAKLKIVGFRPFLQGVILWLIILICSLMIVIRY